MPLHGGGDVPDVDLKRDGDAFMHSLFDAMEAFFPGTGRAAGSSSGTERIPGTHHIWELTTRGVRSQIVLQPTAQGRARMFITGDGDKDEDELANWKGVVKQAREKVADAARPWSWVAYVAQSSRYALQARLFGEHQIGELLLAGAPEALVRPARSPWDLRGTTYLAQQLIAVGGSSAASSWDDAERDAFATARLAAGFLSLLWDLLFEVVQDPRQVAEPDDDGKPVRPLAFPATEAQLLRDGLEVLDLAQLPEFSLPEGISEAWASLLKSTDLKRAVLAYQEGYTLLERHTSYSALAFVSIIESLADGPAERCDSCNQIKGSTARFRKALEPLVGPTGADLLSRMYEKRSKTAHEGALHGLELLPSMSFPRFLSADPEFAFRSEVELLRFACKVQLRHRLGLPNLPHPALRLAAAECGPS